MALLTPPDILPEAMRFLVRAILALSDEVERDELIALVAPTGLVEAIKSLGSDPTPAADDESDLKTGGTVIADKSLAALATLGIVQTTGGRVRLAAVPNEWRKSTDVDSFSFSRHLRDRVFVTADPTAPVGDSRGVMDLVHGLVVLNAADTPLQPFSAFEPDKSGEGRAFMEHQRSLLGDDRSGWPIPNREQWIPFRRWAAYLGLASAGHKGLIADSSAALAQGLREFPSGEYDIEQFVAECGQAVPTLDGGSLHRYHPATDSSHSLLSTGLSMSLLHLEADGLVVLSKRSDIGTRTLRTGSDSSADRPVSHVKWAGAISQKVER
ncbi:hypothetical protein ABQE93_24895 [Mycolicibacterium sp. XJ662]